MLNSEETAAYLGVSAKTLPVLRSRGAGCPFRMINGRPVYDERDLEVYLDVRSSRQREQAEKRAYTLIAKRGGTVEAVIRRRAASVEAAIADLMLYPSFSDCEVTEQTEPKVSKASAAERIRREFNRVRGALTAAVIESVQGDTASKRAKGSRDTDRVLDRILKNALS